MQRTLNVVIADDEQLVRDMLSEAVQETGLPIRISVTDNGRDCLTLLKGGHVDIAFIDIHMPELSGMEAFWVARKQGIRTFAVIITGAATADARGIAARLKAYEFLTKPFTIDDVVRIIRAINGVLVPMSMLIVDDSPTMRQVVQKVVANSMFTCDITQASDGAHAIRLCKTQAFDAVLLDCNMPDVDGLATLRRLRTIRPDIRVVMISAEHDPEKERLALQGGACAFMQKPFYPEDIDGVLHMLHGLQPPNLLAERYMAAFERNAPPRFIRQIA